MRTAYHIETGRTVCTWREEVCGLQSCGVSQKVGKWPLLYKAAVKGTRENRKQGGPVAYGKARVTSSTVSCFKKRYNLLRRSLSFVYSFSMYSHSGWASFVVVQGFLLFFGEYYFIVYNTGFTLIVKKNQRNACGMKKPLLKETQLWFLFSAFRLIWINY